MGGRGLHYHDGQRNINNIDTRMGFHFAGLITQRQVFSLDTIVSLTTPGPTVETWCRRREPTIHLSRDFWSSSWLELHPDLLR